jgi:hypothetical protein
MAQHSGPEYRSLRQPPQTSTLAVVCLVTGIATWVIVPVLGAIIAVITGHMARNEVRASAGRISGDGLATAGLVLGYLQLGVIALSICLAIVFLLVAPAIFNFTVSTPQVIGTPTPFGQ